MAIPKFGTAIIGPIGKSFERVRKGFQKVPTEHGGTLGTHIKTVFRPNLLTKPFFSSLPAVFPHKRLIG